MSEVLLCSKLKSHFVISYPEHGQPWRNIAVQCKIPWHQRVIEVQLSSWYLKPMIGTN